MTVAVLDVRVGTMVLARDGQPVQVVGRELDHGIGGAGGPRLWLRLQDAAGVESLVEYTVTTAVEQVSPTGWYADAEQGAADDGS